MFSANSPLVPKKIVHSTVIKLNVFLIHMTFKTTEGILIILSVQNTEQSATIIFTSVMIVEL